MNKWISTGQLIFENIMICFPQRSWRHLVVVRQRDEQGKRSSEQTERSSANTAQVGKGSPKGEKKWKRLKKRLNRPLNANHSKVIIKFLNKIISIIVYYKLFVWKLSIKCELKSKTKTTSTHTGLFFLLGKSRGNMLHVIVKYDRSSKYMRERKKERVY